MFTGNLLSSISLLLLVSCTVVSCHKTEYVTEYIEVPNEQEIVITVKKDDTGYYGASGFVNGEYKEYQGCEYFTNLANQDKIIFLIANFEWYDNILWAHREVIDMNSIDSNFALLDTIHFHANSSDEFSRVYHLEQDGDVGAECYEILDDGTSTSWVMFTEYHKDVGEIAGTLHADYVISDICPPKLDPSQPDTIRIRDFHFRAKFRE